LGPPDTVAPSPPAVTSVPSPFGVSFIFLAFTCLRASSRLIKPCSAGAVVGASVVAPVSVLASSISGLAFSSLRPKATFVAPLATPPPIPPEYVNSLFGYKLSLLPQVYGNLKTYESTDPINIINNKIQVLEQFAGAEIAPAWFGPAMIAQNEQLVQQFAQQFYYILFSYLQLNSIFL
jgi:hypothetical protein